MEGIGHRRRTEQAEHLLAAHAFLELLDILGFQQVALEHGLAVNDAATGQQEGEQDEGEGLAHCVVIRIGDGPMIH